MSNDDWKTLRVPPDAYADAKAQKEAADRRWGDQIVRPDDDEPDDLSKLVDLIERIPKLTADELEERLR